MTNEERITEMVIKHFTERQAFPSPFDASTLAMVKGLTRRELFAAMAMQGILASDKKSELPKEYVALSSVEYAEYLCNELDNKAYSGNTAFGCGPDEA